MVASVCQLVGDFGDHYGIYRKAYTSTWDWWNSLALSHINCSEKVLDIQGSPNLRDLKVWYDSSYYELMTCKWAPLSLVQCMLVWCRLLICNFLVQDTVEMQYCIGCVEYGPAILFPDKDRISNFVKWSISFEMIPSRKLVLIFGILRWENN